METIIKQMDRDHINQSVIEIAADILKKGGLVAFPTETVYGLGANALDINAANKIYSAKGRPSDNPLIVHIAREKDLAQLVKDISIKAEKLIKAFWPGPLTMVFNKRSTVPDSITGGLDTVAIRIPSHPIALQLLEEANIPIAAPSANTSGRPSPTKAAHVLEDLNGKIDMIIDGGTVNIGLESTVIDLTSATPIILRPGFITKNMLEEIVGEVLMDPAIVGDTAQDIIPKSPGMKYKHYAPKGQLYIVDGQPFEVATCIQQLVQQKEKEGYKVGIIATKQTMPYYDKGIIKCIGNRSNETEVASNLFSILREFDTLEVDYIYTESFDAQHLGQAIMNRLLKAAGYKVIKI